MWLPAEKLKNHPVLLWVTTQPSGTQPFILQTQRHSASVFRSDHVSLLWMRYLNVPTDVLVNAGCGSAHCTASCTETSHKTKTWNGEVAKSEQYSFFHLVTPTDINDWISEVQIMTNFRRRGKGERDSSTKATRYTALCPLSPGSPFPTPAALSSNAAPAWQDAATWLTVDLVNWHRKSTFKYCRTNCN